MIARVILNVIICICVSSSYCLAGQSGEVRKANDLYAKEEYGSALIQYKKALENEPESNILNYNLGTSMYKTGAFNQSIQHLQKALLTEEVTLKQKASYNLGNALYNSGIEKEFDDPDFAILSLEKALKHFEEAIKLNEEDDDAKNNYEFVKLELERLKLQQQQQQSEQEQPSDQSQENQEKQEQQEQQEQQDQSQQEQNQESSQQEQDQESQQDQQDQEGQGDPQDNQEGENQEEQDQQQDESEDGDQEQEQEQESSDENEQEKSEEEKSEGEDENEDQSDYNNQVQTGTQGVDEGEMTENEAQMLLRGFEQTEQPQKLLNVFKGQIDTSPVEKDW